MISKGAAGASPLASSTAKLTLLTAINLPVLRSRSLFLTSLPFPFKSIGSEGYGPANFASEWLHLVVSRAEKRGVMQVSGAEDWTGGSEWVRRSGCCQKQSAASWTVRSTTQNVVAAESTTTILRTSQDIKHVQLLIWWKFALSCSNLIAL